MLLASATASGLCRVDCLFGRWSKGKIPYGGVGRIRLEDKSVVEDDEEMIGDEDEDENNTDEDENEDAEGEEEDEDEEMQEVELVDDD